MKTWTKLLLTGMYGFILTVLLYFLSILTPLGLQIFGVGGAWSLLLMLAILFHRKAMEGFGK